MGEMIVAHDISHGLNANQHVRADGLPRRDTLNDEQRRDLLEIIEDRYEKRSTIVTSQVPIDHWYDMIGNPTLADAILDRLVHCAYKINLTGDSMRKHTTGLTDDPALA